MLSKEIKIIPFEDGFVVINEAEDIILDMYDGGWDEEPLAVRDYLRCDIDGFFSEDEETKEELLDSFSEWANENLEDFVDKREIK